jgi:hypothetical protein
MSYSRGDAAAALLTIKLATLEVRLDLLAMALERRYREDQPRAPRGTPIGASGSRILVVPATHGAGARRS